MNWLIPTWLMTAMALAALVVFFWERRYEHAFTRSLFFWLYFALTVLPEIPIESARFFTRYFLVVLFLVDVMSWYSRKRGSR